MRQALTLVCIGSLYFCISHPGVFSQSHVEYHIRQHSGLIKLRIALNLRLKIALRDEELVEIVVGFINCFLLVCSLIWNIDDLQQPRVGKSSVHTGELEHPKIQRWFESESYVQAVRFRLTMHFNAAEFA